MSWQHPDWPFSRGNLFSPEIEHFCWLATKPGRVGVEAAVNLLRWVPEHYHGELLARVWRDPPGNRMAWAVLLLQAWPKSDRAIRAVAGTRERVVRWFQAADYDAELVPCFRTLCGHRHDLPARLTLYRGGGLPAEDLARGLAWTPFRSSAADYALKWTTEGRQPGPAIVVRRVARREDVLWRWKNPEAETLVAVPGPWRVHLDDPGRMRSLSREHYEKTARWLVADDRRRAALVAAPEEDPWGGWGLEAGPRLGGIPTGR